MVKNIITSEYASLVIQYRKVLIWSKLQVNPHYSTMSIFKTHFSLENKIHFLETKDRKESAVN